MDYHTKRHRPGKRDAEIIKFVLFLPGPVRKRTGPSLPLAAFHKTGYNGERILSPTRESPVRTCAFGKTSNKKGCICLDQALYENHLTILRSELSMALGCTEPIAIAYAAAKARQLLGEMPEHCTVHCSGNIVKNVMGVTVPNSGYCGRQPGTGAGRAGGYHRRAPRQGA